MIWPLSLFKKRATVPADFIVDAKKEARIQMDSLKRQADRGKWLRAHRKNPRLRSPIHCIAQDTSTTRWKIWEYKPDGTRIEVDPLRNQGSENAQAFHRLMTRPHPNLSFKRFIYLLSTYYLVCGIAPWQMRVGKRGVRKLQDGVIPEQPDNLLPWSPAQIQKTPAQSENGKWEFSNDTRHKSAGVALFDHDNDNTEVDAHQVGSIYNPDLERPLEDGVGQAECLDDEVGIDDAISKFTFRSFLNGTFLGNLIGLPNIQGREKELKAQFKARYTGLDNVGKDYIFEVGPDSGKPEVIRLGHSPAEMLSQDKTDSIRNTCAQVFQVPPERMGILDNSNRSTISSSRQIQQAGNVLPLCIEIQDEINYGLAPRFGSNLRFEFVDIVTEDEQIRNDRVEKSVRIGVMKVNEARGAQGLAEVDDGDVFYVPVNNVAVRRGDNLLEPAPEQGSPNEEGDEDGASPEDES